MLLILLFPLVSFILPVHFLLNLIIFKLRFVFSFISIRLIPKCSDHLIKKKQRFRELEKLFILFLFFFFLIWKTFHLNGQKLAGRAQQDAWPWNFTNDDQFSFSDFFFNFHSWIVSLPNGNIIPFLRIIILNDQKLNLHLVFSFMHCWLSVRLPIPTVTFFFV